MVVDTSALVALILDEPEAEAFQGVFERMINEAKRIRISAVTFVESCVVLRRGGHIADVLLDDLVAKLDIEIVPVTADQAYRARFAYYEFGKGFHPARLNFADCFAYALAKELGEPLLFKGRDFERTDVEAVPWAQESL
jgi:ribonuclease VapC